jgi:hypothetical protein
MKKEVPLPVVLSLLLAFGISYNEFVAKLEEEGREHGFLAFLVIFGTAITLAGAWTLIGKDNTLKVLACFVASGTPMTIGSISRYMEERAQEEKWIRAQAREGWVIEEAMEERDAET